MHIKMSTAKRVSIIPPPPASGSFMIEQTEFGTIVATPSKNGKPEAQPTHVFDKGTGTWTPTFGMSPYISKAPPGSKLSTPYGT